MNKPSRILLPTLSILLFSSCTFHVGGIITPIPTIIATSTTLPSTKAPTPTFIPTLTSTPVSPLASHEWAQSEPLVTYGSGGFDGYCGFETAYPIDFTLFPNGELYSVNWNSGLRANEIETTTLSRQTTCKLLNSIDQAGFFDYDPSTYVRDPHNWNAPIMGAPTTEISVKAWRSKSVSLYALGYFVDPAQVDQMKKDWGLDCGVCPNLEFPTILPALRKTFQLLLQYQPANLHVYQPGRLGVWVAANGDRTDAVVWPLKLKTLAGLNLTSEFAADQPNMILTGTDAITVYKLFKKSFNVCGENVTEGDNVYRVLARPLLPNEFPLANKPLITKLNCSPSDGWLEMP